MFFIILCFYNYETNLERQYEKIESLQPCNGVLDLDYYVRCKILFLNIILFCQQKKYSELISTINYIHNTDSSRQVLYELFLEINKKFLNKIKVFIILFREVIFLKLGVCILFKFTLMFSLE